VAFCPDTLHASYSLSDVVQENVECRHVTLHGKKSVGGQESGTKLEYLECNSSVRFGHVGLAGCLARGDWNRGSGQPGTRWQGWTRREWTTRPVPSMKGESTGVSVKIKVLFFFPFT